MSPWPCPKASSRPPGYVRGGPQNRPSVAYQGYRARPLLNCTVGSFYLVESNELAQAQVDAKEGFLKLYERCDKMTTQQFQQQDMLQMLTKFAHYFDDFFFFGSLFQGKETRVTLRFVPSILDGGVNLGHTEDANGDGSKMNVVIAGKRVVRDGGGIADLELWDLVYVLYHELCHAYLALYVCRCLRCAWYRLNTRGWSGHGPTFRVLDFCGLQTFLSWGIQRDTHISPSIENGVDDLSYRLECYMASTVKGVDPFPHSLLANLRVNPSRSEIIKVSGTAITIDQKRLRLHVKKHAKKSR